MKSFVKRQRVEQDTTFILKEINPAELDRSYSMKEFIEAVSNREFGFIEEKRVTKRSTELKTKLENLGIVKDQLPRLDTICLSETLNFKICVSPTNNGQSKSVEDLRRVMCWHCKHSLPVKAYPLSLPLKWIPADERFEGEGVFCSFNCIVAYLRDYPSLVHRECGGLISMLYKKVFGKPVQLRQIVPAPNWRLLESFGGPLSIGEYRKTFQTVEFRQNFFGSQNVKIEHEQIPLITRSELFMADGEFAAA
jgi:hypothetical protein